MSVPCRTPLRSLNVALVATFLATACVAKTPEAGSGDGSQNFEEMRSALMEFRPEFQEFLHDGPVAFTERLNVTLKIPPGDPLVADELIPDGEPAMPLVIIAHGNHSRKEAHRYQARRLASFGMHTLVLQLENTNHWLMNGQLIARLVRRLHDSPGLLQGEFDPENIILVGHSFGGSAVAIAAARGAPIKGLILLDPAVVSERRLSAALARIKQPVMLLGADKDVFRSRQRRLFFRKALGEMAEVSIRGATHDDAQFPSMFSLSTFGLDPFTSKAKQELFAGALTATAFSMASTGGLDFAWTSFQEMVDSGEMKNPRRHGARLDEPAGQAAPETGSSR